MRSMFLWSLFLGVGILLIAGQTPADQNRPSVGSAAQNVTWPYHEVQLRGEIICPPQIVPNRGIVVLSDDRMLSLISVSGEIKRTWTLPRFAEKNLYVAHGLAWLRLVDGRTLCINLGGWMVWAKVLETPQSDAWMVSADGRVIVAAQKKWYVFKPDGSKFQTLTMPENVERAESADAEGFVVLLHDGSRRRLHAQDLSKLEPYTENAPATMDDLLIHSVERADSYEVIVRHSTDDFKLEGKGRMLYLTRDDQNGVVCWGDTSWRIGIKRYPESLRAPEAFDAELDKDRKAEVSIMGFLLPRGESAGQEVLAMLRRHFERLSDASWFEGVAWDIVGGFGSFHLPSPIQQVLMPEMEQLLSEEGSIESISRLVQWLEQNRSDSETGLRIACALGVDPDGRILEWIRDTWLLPWKTADLQTVKMLSRVFDRLETSWPETSRQTAILFKVWLRVQKKSP